MKFEVKWFQLRLFGNNSKENKELDDLATALTTADFPLYLLWSIREMDAFLYMVYKWKSEMCGRLLYLVLDVNSETRSFYLKLAHL